MSNHAPVTPKVAVNRPLARMPATRSPVSLQTIRIRTTQQPREESNDTRRSGRKPTPVTWARAPETQK